MENVGIIGILAYPKTFAIKIFLRDLVFLRRSFSWYLINFPKNQYNLSLGNNKMPD